MRECCTTDADACPIVTIVAHAHARAQILNNMQTITNLLPNLNVESLVKSMFGKTNDLHLVSSQQECKKVA